MASLRAVTEAPATAVKQHPAETSGVAGAIALLIVHAFGVTDPTVIVSLAVVVGFVPAAVTWTIKLLRKSPSPPPTS